MTVIKVKYDEKYLKRTFKDWDLVELKSCLKELEDKRKNSIISREELSWIQPIREEIERRNNMLNQLVIVGRIIENPIVEKTENGKEVSNFTLAVPRPYKGVDGEYETDLIPIFLTPGLTENTIPYCKKGKLIGVKARLENRNNKLQVIAEKVTFLSTIDK